MQNLFFFQPLFLPTHISTFAKSFQSKSVLYFAKELIFPHLSQNTMRQQLQNLENQTSPKTNLWEGEYQFSHANYLNEEIKDIYKKKIKITFEDFKNSNYCFQYSEFDFEKNGEESDSKASTLSKMCMESMYPIKIILDSKGLIQDIELTKSVQQTCKEMDEIKLFFEDDFSFDYIERMKNEVQNTKEMLNKFRKTLLFSFLFSTVFSEKLDNDTENSIYESFYPWISNATPILFEVDNSISDVENSDEEFIKIKQKGISIDYRSFEELYYLEFEYNKDILANENSIDCEFYAEYTIKKENKSLQRIEATFQNFVEENIEKETFLLERLV